jgi:hypothetical protein
MQINFSAKKLKEANEYVNLLNPPKIKMPKVVNPKEEKSLLQKLFKLLFK